MENLLHLVTWSLYSRYRGTGRINKIPKCNTQRRVNSATEKTRAEKEAHHTAALLLHCIISLYDIRLMFDLRI